MATDRWISPAGKQMESKTFSVTNTIQACRTGWPGVWDAIKAAVSGNDRFTVPKTITFQFCARLPKGQAMYIDESTISINQETDNEKA